MPSSSFRGPVRDRLGRCAAGPALLALLAGCQGAPPAGDLAEDAPPPPPATVSRFTAPVDYDFTPVLAVLERVVPERFGSLDSLHVLGHDEHKHYAFEAERGALTAYADGGLLHLRATVSYSARAFYKPPIGPTLTAGCGKDAERPRIVLELATPLTLTPDWHLRSHARLVRLEPASTGARDRCDVSVLKYDVTSKVVEAARKALEKRLPDVDRKIARVDLRERFAGWWGALSRPIHLAEGVWLVLDPRAVEMGRVSGSGHVLTVPVTVAAQPRIVTAAVAPQVDAPALPPLGHAAAAEGFHVVLEGAVDYATASRVITTALARRRIATGGRAVRIDSVVVAPGGHRRIDMAVTFSGDANGTLHLVGRPVLDAARGEITVPDLDYDLDTDDQLVNAFAWLRSDALRQLLRDKAHLPVSPALERGRALLAQGLNRRLGRTVALSGSVDSVGVRALYVTRAGLVVRAVATGRAALAVERSAPSAAGALARAPTRLPAAAGGAPGVLVRAPLR